ncbi:MAG: hypothetical protein RIS92_3080 [Verrucomicrobiota bacterium]
MKLARGDIASGGINLHHFVSHRLPSNVFDVLRPAIVAPSMGKSGDSTLVIRELMGTRAGVFFSLAPDSHR